MTREQVMLALFNIAITTPGLATTGRRLIDWRQVADQPALFTRHISDEYLPRRTGMPPRVVMKTEVVLYSNAGQDPDTAPEIAINNLIDAFEIVIQAPPGRESQTLGGQVTHAWIEGEIMIWPGDLNGQAIAIVPVHVLVPTLHGPLG